MRLHPLLALIAPVPERALARYVLHLKEENPILRAPVGAQIRTRPHERARLLKFGKPLGPGIDELITIVTLRTSQPAGPTSVATRVVRE